MSNIGSVNFTYSGTAVLPTYNASFVKITGFTHNAYVSALNYAYLTASNTQAYYYFNSTPPSADYSVSVDGILNSVIASNEIAALFRVSTTESTFYKLGLTSAGALTLTRRLAGANSVIGTGTVSVSAGNTYNVKIEGSGDQISGYVNGVLAISPVTNADITAAGRPGCALIAGGGIGPTSTTGWALDNLSWDTIESGAVDATAPGATLTGTATLTPGTATSDSPADATAPGATLTGTATLTPGAATGQQSATAPGATLTGTSTLTPGSATAASAGVFVTDISINNTGSVMASTFVHWRWNQGEPFVAPTSVTYGTGTTDADGRLTVTGLPTGFGWLLYATPDRASMCYEEGTVT